MSFPPPLSRFCRTISFFSNNIRIIISVLSQICDFICPLRVDPAKKKPISESPLKLATPVETRFTRGELVDRDRSITSFFISVGPLIPAGPSDELPAAALAILQRAADAAWDKKTVTLLFATSDFLDLAINWAQVILVRSVICVSPAPTGCVPV